MINGRVIIEAMNSEMDCAVSRPFSPKHAFRITIHGMRDKPERSAARKEATFAFPMD